MRVIALNWQDRWDNLDRCNKQTRKHMSEEDLRAELERLRNENAALKKGASSGIRLKVSEKGAVSAYGLGRFPVTFDEYDQFCEAIGQKKPDDRCGIEEGKILHAFRKLRRLRHPGRAD